MTIKKAIAGVLCCVVLAVSTQPSFAQQKKGDKEVQAFLTGFNFNWGGDATSTSPLDPSVKFTSTGNSQGLFVSGALGYFLTRKSEIGGGLTLSLSRFEFCHRTFADGQLIDETCDSDGNVSFGLLGFYRYNFAGAESRGFPFVGASVGISDVTTNFTGNVSARPHVGYKYFVKRNVALDFSVGYSIEVNKVNESAFFTRDRSSSVNGQLGLSFVF